MKRKEILDQALACVCGDRGQDYGSPENNFRTIADMWSAFMGIEITPTEVAAMMALLKIARVASGHSKADNWIDLAGYAACGGELDSIEEERRVENV